MGADRVAEAGLVLARLEPVAPRLLHVRDADREVVRRCQVVVDDRTVTHRRAENPKAAGAELSDESVQRAGIDDAWLSHGLAREATRIQGTPGSGKTPIFLRICTVLRNAGGVPTVERRLFNVRGVVQGVGFRPFVYGLARRHELSGFVRNDGGGVVIEAEGEARALEAFAAELRGEAPSARSGPGRLFLRHRGDRPDRLRDHREPHDLGARSRPARHRNLRRLPARALRPG